MATQNEGFTPIDFSITSPFTNVKIIEVSEEIVDIIEVNRRSGTKSLPVLQFKSAPPLESGSTSILAQGTPLDNQKHSILHLCSETQVWAIKQVSTSNSVYLIRPSELSEENQSSSTTTPRVEDADEIRQDGDDTDSMILTHAARGSVSAVSQVRNFLELLPVKPAIPDIARAVLDLVPVYDLRSEEDETFSVLQMQKNRKPAISAKALMGGIPAPDAQICHTCTKLCVFEDNDQKCRLPSPTTMLAVWSKIIQGCAIELIKLDHALNEERIIDTIESSTDRLIAKVMLRKDGTLEVLGLIQSNSADDSSTSATVAATLATQSPRYLKPEETSLFVAKLILRAGAYRHLILEGGVGSENIDSSEFIRQWSDLVPSSFVKYCTLDMLRSHGLSSLINNTRADGGKEYLRWEDSYEDLILGNDIEDGVSHPTSVGAGAGDTLAVSKPATTNTKRKWHEKFGAQRNAKR